MAKAWRKPSWLAVALLVALLAVAMERSVAEEERSLAEEEASAPAADAPEAAAEAAVADEEEATADDGDDGAPAPAPATAGEEEEEEAPMTFGAKAKAGLHNMMEGLSASKAKLECKVLGSCPDSDAAGEL